MNSSSMLSRFRRAPDSNAKTFDKDETLPSLPLPDLDHTLTRYLDSLKPFTTSSEFEKSQRLVAAFRDGVGARLHEKLQQKARTERNWVDKWWLDYGYLQTRSPLLPYSSMVGVTPRISGITYGSEEDQIKNAALLCYYTVEFWSLLRNEELRQDVTAGGSVHMSMSQYRRLFNTARLPGEEKDSLVSLFKTAEEGSCPSNVVVMCHGRLFSVDCLDENGNPLTPPVWEKKLRSVLDVGNANKEGQNIGMLTCDERTNWCKNRKHLISISSRNGDIMRKVESSMFVLVLDYDTPESIDALSNYNMNGDYNNRWSDKSLTLVVYKNGLFGTICDHTPFDGIASMSCLHYGYTAFVETRGVWNGPEGNCSSGAVEELKFDLDRVIVWEIQRLSKETYEHRKKMFIVRMAFKDFGKKEIQRFKVHPDTYIQMALQLAYFTYHKKPAPCYETATTRAFYNGRTETVRSCTPECVEWATAMLDGKSSAETRAGLLMKAIRRHDQLMAEARENAGCDRHMFGLYCIAMEEGMELPELFSDPAYAKSGGGGNFILSTSCTGYSPLSGGVAPMCEDGYGIFYSILPERIYFTISVNTSSKETDVNAFFHEIRLSMTTMRSLLMYALRASKL